MGSDRWPVGLRKPTALQALIALTLLGAALRFATIDVQSIWLDESATMILVHRGFAGMLSHLSASESAPPLYYILVWVWTRIFGLGPVGFRTFSALVGTVTIPVLYVAGRRVSTHVGLWAAALAVVNPAMYYYSQEARCYALLILLSAVAFVCWQKTLEKPTGRWLAAWSIASILAVLTHYFAAFLFIPEAIVLLWRLDWRRVLAPAAAVVLVGAALVPLALSQLGNGHKSEWIQESPLVSRIAETAKQYLVGLYGPIEIVTAAVAGLLVLGALALLVRRGEPRERRLARDAGLIAAAAIALPLLLSVAHIVDVFDGRNVIATWVPCAVLVAIGLGAAKGGRTGAALGIALCSVSLAVIGATNVIPAYQRDNWRGAASTLPPAPTGGRALITYTYGSAPLSIYLPGLNPLTRSQRQGLPVTEVDLITLRTRRTGRSPLPPITSVRPPSGFHLVGMRRTESFAVSRFRAPKPSVVSLAELRHITPYREVEVSLQHG